MKLQYNYYRKGGTDDMNEIICGKIFTEAGKAGKLLNDKEIKDFIIGIAEAANELKIVLYGFIYQAGKGFYTVGPLEELHKFKNKNIEAFDFAQYLKENSDNPNIRIFLYDLSNENKLVLNEMVKSPT